jgi:hypothetical protein
MSDDTTTPVAVSGATTYRGRRIKFLQTQIAELETAVRTVLTTGVSYSLSNSHSVTRANVADIQSQLAAMKSELAGLLLHRQYQPLRREPTKFY